jgi:MOSC domain-containing protein YiiM
MKPFEVLSVNISTEKGVPKTPMASIRLKKDFGVEGDAHGGPWHRQVSLLAAEDIATMTAKGADVDFGDFAENITTKGIELHTLPIGTKLTIDKAILEVTQIGKECHKGCAIMQKVGECIMPKRGIFAKVIEEGEIKNGSIGTYDI